MNKYIRAIIAGLFCGTLASMWIGYAWKWDMPYTNFAYQEFSTEDNDAGFEYVVGYTGSQKFYWDELIRSRSFKLSVINESGESPESQWGLLPSVEVTKYLPWNSEKRDSLFLVFSWTLCTEPLNKINQNTQQQIDHFSSAFVEAAKSRGVHIEAVGKPGTHSRDHGSLHHVLRRWVPKIFFLSISTAVFSCMIVTRNKPNKPVEVTPHGAPHL